MENQNPQPVNNQTVVAPQPQSSGPSKTFLILIAIILLAAVGAGAYFLGMKNVPPTPLPVATAPGVMKPTPTVGIVIPTVDASVSATWRTYTNPKLGFSFKYPPSVKTTQPVYPDEVVGLISINARDNSPRIIDIRNIDNPGNLSIQAYNEINKNAANPALIWGDLSGEQITTIGGKKAYFIPATNTGTTCDPELCDSYLIPLPNKILEIYRITEDPNIMFTSDTESKPVFNTVISTMTFTQ